MTDRSPPTLPPPNLSYTHPRYLQTLFHISPSFEFVISKGWFGRPNSGLDIPFPQG